MGDVGGDRNFEIYQQSYFDLPFEPTQESFRRKNLLSWLEKNKNLGRILEIGSGRNSIFNFLPENSSGLVIEPIQEFLNIAKKDLSDRDNLDFFLGTFEDFINSEKSVTFDTIIISSLLHELTDPSLFLTQLKNIMTPDSKVFFIVSNRFSVHRILGVHLGIQKNLMEKTDTQISMQQYSGSFSPNELSAILKDNGFEVIRMRSFFIKPLPHSVMQDLLDNQIIDPEFLEALDDISDFLPELGSELIVEARIDR
jgi:SAM-dependent methyltransferase